MGWNSNLKIIIHTNKKASFEGICPYQQYERSKLISVTKKKVVD